MDYFSGILFWMLLFGLATAIVGGAKGRGLFGFLIGFLTGPAGFVIVLLLPPSNRRACPVCGKSINKDAPYCVYCRRPLPPVEELATVRGRSRDWKAWAVALGVVVAGGAALYSLMSSRLTQRETGCKERCLAAGHKGYQYTPPTGVGRALTMDRCECTK